MRDIIALEHHSSLFKKLFFPKLHYPSQIVILRCTTHLLPSQEEKISIRLCRSLYEHFFSGI